MEKLKVTKGTIARTLVIILALLNQGLTIFGKNPIPIDDAMIEQMVAYAFDIVATLIVYWKNNSWSQAALKADVEMRAEKAIKG